VSRRLAAIAITVAIAGALSTLPATTARSAGAFRCRMSATKLAGRIEVSFRLRNWRAGQTWRVRLFDGRVRFLDRTRTTGATGGLAVVGTTIDRPGLDEMKGIARGPVSGARCEVELTI
jgi:hypothetical protein